MTKIITSEARSTQEILDNIRNGNEEMIKQIYRQYRDEFLVWATRDFAVNEADAADVFQDSVIVFYLNVINKQLTELTASVKTYLYAIAKNKLLKKIRKDVRLVLKEEIEENTIKDLNLDMELQIEKTHRQQKIAEALGKLGEKCQEILKLFYFRNYSHESISIQMNYSSEETSRTMLRKCRKNLAKLLGEDIL